MESFQTDSKIGFQFLPSDKLSPVANYSHCQLTLQPAPSQLLLSQPAKFAFACHVDTTDESRQGNAVLLHR